MKEEAGPHTPELGHMTGTDKSFKIRLNTERRQRTLITLTFDLVPCVNLLQVQLTRRQLCLHHNLDVMKVESKCEMLKIKTKSGFNI